MTKEKSYLDYWAYQEVSKNWKSDVVTEGNVTEITIWYDKKAKDIYARFKIEKFEYGDIDLSGYAIYLVDDDGDREFLNDKVDFYDTLNNCIESCFYYFNTRF